MEKIEEKSVQLVKKIIELDLLRDELLEELMVLTRNRAYDLLRTLQNSLSMKSVKTKVKFNKRRSTI
jgi:hypothetical protein